MSTLTVEQARQYASAAGFSGLALDIIVAIARAESGLRTTATNTNTDSRHSVDRGILQINDYWHREVTDTCAFDPACAFRAAYRISNQGTSFKQWATYLGGQYRKYLPSGTVGTGKVGGSNGNLQPLSTTNGTLIPSIDLGWLVNPARVGKLLAGIMLIGVGIFGAFGGFSAAGTAAKVASKL